MEHLLLNLVACSPARMSTPLVMNSGCESSKMDTRLLHRALERLPPLPEGLPYSVNQLVSLASMNPGDVALISRLSWSITQVLSSSPQGPSSMGANSIFNERTCLLTQLCFARRALEVRGGLG